MNTCEPEQQEHSDEINEFSMADALTHTMDWAGLPNVAVVDDIVLVGEAHGYEESRVLVEQVLDSVQPDVVGLETDRLGYNLLTEADEGLFAAGQWACQQRAPVACLDTSLSTVQAALPQHTDFETVREVANQPQRKIEQDGRMPFEVMVEARRQVYERFGEQAYKIIYPFRERQMARRLRGFSSQSERTAVAVVGAFHIPWLADQLRQREGGFIEDNRVELPAAAHFCS